MLSRRRLPLIVAFPALYVGFAAVRAGESGASIVLVAIGIVIALVGGRVREGVPDAAARARLFSSAGLSIAIATAALSTRAGWASVLREGAAWLGGIAAMWAISAIDGDVGLAPKASEVSTSTLGVPPRLIVRLGIAALSLVWLIAIVVDMGAWLRGEVETGSAVAAVCGVLAMFLTGATALLVGKARRLELDVPPRALASAGGAAAGLILAITLALSGVIAADASAVLGSALAATFVVRLAAHPHPLALARHGRRTLTLVLFGGPVAALAAIAVEGRWSGAGGAALVLAAIAVLVGAMASKLEEPFLPVRGVLIEALADAREAAREREAREAMAHSLMRLREASSVGLGPGAAPSPELWLLHPTRVWTVNAAGYLQERSAELPEQIFEVALGEPHATLRTSVLAALEVRRADLRPLLAWLNHRDALFATVIAESSDPDGLLVVPVGARTEELTLEEARAAKQVADAFIAVCQATSAKARHLHRERDLKRQIDGLDDQIARLRHALDLEEGRHVLAAARLARPATVGIYSAASRMAQAELERRIAQEAPIVIMARSGVDVVSILACAHLAGPRKTGPLVVVDGTSSREHDPERWMHPTASPLALCDRGLLVLVDGAALPRDVQGIIARAVAERRSPWERAAPLDLSIAVTVVDPDRDLSELLAPELAVRFEATEPIVFPGLSERAEDLRSIVADRLAREGLRVRGTPVGIDAAAFARLVEYPFRGEDAELASIVTKLVARVVRDGGEVVRAADVDALRLNADGEEDPRAVPSPDWARR